MHKHRFPVGPMPTRGRIRAAVVVLGLFIGIAPFLGGMTAASAAPPPPWTTTIAASPQSTWPTLNSTIVVTANGDVGPTPYYIRIYDTSTSSATLLATCGTGTTCSVSVTRPTPAVGYFQGRITDLAGNVVPGSQSPTISVNWQGVTLSLAANPTTLNPNQPSTLTATSSLDIGPSPFWIQIYDRTAGTRLNACAFGTTCSVTVIQPSGTHCYVAYLSAYTDPPTQIQATSNLGCVTWSSAGWRISLSANPSPFTFGTTVLTANVNGNVGPTPYYIEIFNEDGTRVAVCGSGSSCATTVTPAFPPGSDFIAFVSDSSSTFEPGNIQASSNVVHVTHLFFLPLNPSPSPTLAPPSAAPGSAKPALHAPAAPTSPVVVPKR
jgi:hypothetical protein